MTERTENIIGACVIIAVAALILGFAGWAVPNYYVYFVNTVSQAGPDCDAVQQ